MYEHRFFNDLNLDASNSPNFNIFEKSESENNEFEDNALDVNALSLNQKKRNSSIMKKKQFLNAKKRSYLIVKKKIHISSIALK